MFGYGMVALGGAFGYWFHSWRKSKNKTIIECDTGATKNVSYWFPHIKDPKMNHYNVPYSLVEIYLNPEKGHYTDTDSYGIWGRASSD